MFARHSLQGVGKDVLYNTVKQLLTLGLSSEDGFVPLDNELRNFSYKKYWNHVFSRQVDIGCVEERNASCTVCK